ncbi:MAG: Sec-independent protein translocase protein TatC [Actinomycetota bacterium]|jgi:sec-independent protein translocase protein TatC
MKTPFKRSDQPTVATPEDRMTLTQHLAELRSRIIRSLLAVLLGIIVILAAYDRVLGFLLQPYRDLCAERPDFCGITNGSLIFTDPLEGFSTRLSIATYGGIILALPVLMWQAWRFIVPALHAKEKKYAIPFVFSSVALFALGGYIAYWTLEKALEFLIAWSGQDVQAAFRVGQYVRLVGLMVAAFGIAFEFPVLLVALQLIGVLTPQTLLKGWRYALLACFVIAAVITPSGDPYSMLALAIPMSLFYLLSILIGYLAQRRKLRRAPAD